MRLRSDTSMRLNSVPTRRYLAITGDNLSWLSHYIIMKAESSLSFKECLTQRKKMFYSAVLMRLYKKIQKLKKPELIGPAKSFVNKMKVVLSTL